MACYAWYASKKTGRTFKLEDHDVYLALFPISIKVPYYLHEEKSTMDFYNDLKRLNHDGTSNSQGWGTIGISIPDILAGKEWNKKSHGLFSHERMVLQMFAVQFGFKNSSEWKQIDILKKILG
jgi:hypothetical protein